MKRNLLYFVLLTLVTFLPPTLRMTAQTVSKPFVVPEILQWTGEAGEFCLDGQSVTYDGENLSYAANHLAQCLGLHAPTMRGKASGRAIHLSITEKSALGKEGYEIRIGSGAIHLQAETPQGVLWGVQTLVQMFRDRRLIPCGTVRDVPDYPLRGFMLDCGRKYIPMDYLYNLVRTMSYYKMNTLQVHLNDNGWPRYFNNDWNRVYAAFRLESELFPGLTSIDGHYGKAEFRQFIRDAARMGVEVIPEIDTPAHSLAFTHYRPSLASRKYGIDHLDLMNPEVLPFLDSLYMEYLGGEDPVFCCPRVHIGTDEYNNKDSVVVEKFRAFADHLIQTVQSYGKEACMWGSLTHCKGKTPVRSQGVLMNIWYNGYAQPQDMLDQGYKLVCVPDTRVYIVPGGTWYPDYLNCKYLYERWTPALIGGKQFPERHPQIMGGLFALWNDGIGNGISLGDIHDRVVPAMQVMAHKCWHAQNDTVGYAGWDGGRKHFGDAPFTDEIGRTEIGHLPRLRPEKTLVGKGLHQLGYDYAVDFDITWAREPLGTVLTTSPRSTFYLSDPIGGWMGFSRDGYLITFHYKGRPGMTEHITIRGTNKSTTLLVDGKLVQELDIQPIFQVDGESHASYRTLFFPLGRSGSFRSKICNFKARHLSK